jgi:hypothetical protein
MLPVSARGQAITLSENGVRVSLDLPAGSVVSYNNGNVVILEDPSATVEIEDSSVKERIDFETRVCEGLKAGDPDTLLEELPGLETDMGEFTMMRLTYNDHNDEKATTLTVFCELNYRYIYTVTLRRIGEIDESELLPFLSGAVTKTPIRFEPVMLAVTAATALVGLLIILLEFRQKHCWLRARGIITGYVSLRKTTAILVSYRTENGEEVTGSHNIAGAIGLAVYSRHKDQEVEITYSPRRPMNVNLALYKGTYICGLLLLALAAVFVYLMIFEL